MPRSSPIGVALVLALSSGGGLGAEFGGSISLEPRAYIDEPLFAVQPSAGPSPSVVMAPEWRLRRNDGQDSFVLAPFLRWDADDDHRSHADLRLASWTRRHGPWTALIGVDKVFWGVTESRHLVDVVNQTDQVEDIDEEDKLGQPMLMLERWTGRGTFAAFLLPGFRERTFPAGDARLRGPLPIATGDAEYESGAGRRRMDAALRWSRSAGPWDVGLAGFHGTSREPRLVPAMRGGEAVLVPVYDVIGQAGLDLQHTRGAWLWKLEAILRRGRHQDFAATVAGFEYTLFDLNGSGMDLGLLAEHLYDGRGELAPPTVYEDDVFSGLRLALNDAAGTRLLAGAIVDRDDGAVLGIVEAGRRLGGDWKIELEARLFMNIDAGASYLAGFRQDSFVTLRAQRFF